MLVVLLNLRSIVDKYYKAYEEDLEEEHLPEIAREAAGGDHTGLRDRFKREGSDILKRLKKTPVGTLWEEIKPLDTTGAKEPEVYDLPPILVTAPSYHFFIFSFRLFISFLCCCSFFFFVFRVTTRFVIGEIWLQLVSPRGPAVL